MNLETFRLRGGDGRFKVLPGCSNALCREHFPRNSADQLGSRMAQHLLGGSVYVYVAEFPIQCDESFTNALENPFDFRRVMPLFGLEALSIADVDDSAQHA